jgi:hypothetical protein
MEEWRLRQMRGNTKEWAPVRQGNGCTRQCGGGAAMVLHSGVLQLCRVIAGCGLFYTGRELVCEACGTSLLMAHVELEFGGEGPQQG